METKTKTKTKATAKLEKVIIKRFHATWIVRHESELSESELLFLASKNPENLRVIDRLAGLLTPQKSEAAINLTFQQAQAPQYQPQAQPQAPQYQPQAPQYQPQAQPQAFQDNPDKPIEWEKDKSGKFWETYHFKPEYLLHFGFIETTKAGRISSYSIFEKENHKIYVFPTAKGRKVRIAINLEQTKMLYEDCRQSFKTQPQAPQAPQT